MARKTKLESLKTCELIVDSAEQLFSSKGFAQTTLHDVAEHAGLTRGAIYWHFKDKTALLDAVLARAQLPWDALPQRCDEIDRPLSVAQLATFLAQCIETIIGDPRLHRVSLILLHTTELVEDNRRVQVRLTRTLERIGNFLAAMLGKATDVPRAAVDRAASAVKAMLTGVVYEALIEPNAVALGHLPVVLEHTLASCLAAPCVNPALSLAGPGG